MVLTIAWIQNHVKIFEPCSWHSRLTRLRNGWGQKKEQTFYIIVLYVVCIFNADKKKPVFGYACVGCHRNCCCNKIMFNVQHDAYLLRYCANKSWRKWPFADKLNDEDSELKWTFRWKLLANNFEFEVLSVQSK